MKPAIAHDWVHYFARRCWYATPKCGRTGNSRIQFGDLTTNGAFGGQGVLTTSGTRQSGAQGSVIYANVF